MVVDPSEEQRLVGEFAQVFVRLVGQAQKHQLRMLRGIISSDFIVKILFWSLSTWHFLAEITLSGNEYYENYFVQGDFLEEIHLDELPKKSNDQPF